MALHGAQPAVTVTSPQGLEALPPDVAAWREDHVGEWLRQGGWAEYVARFREQRICGVALLLLEEEDLRREPLAIPVLGHVKRLAQEIRALRSDVEAQCEADRAAAQETSSQCNDLIYLAFAVVYIACVAMITAYSMVLAHERVPNQYNYPPLPDVFLDTIPTLDGAFHISEYCATALSVTWTIVVVFHKCRVKLLTRFCAITATCFLLRSVTMWLTALSVPATHLPCAAVPLSSFEQRIQRAWQIASGLGMSIAGVQTCGDYMFSGHTTMLTLLNYFCREYTPRHWVHFQTVCWALHIVGAFCVLAAHEHYSIDVVLAFVISRQVFLYHHAFAQRICHMTEKEVRHLSHMFPLVVFFERHTTGPVVNQFDVPLVSSLRRRAALASARATRGAHSPQGRSPRSSVAAADQLKQE
eukprot:TRINITY_DN7601_c0_g1_i1.p1 TRINITY_DN7601_c0_g1~~TRINITY_DN7601_c0_g1_i1.p1  ORF type:complete len:414 (+),score=111.45 TRINITY_DN7601_c0_g1_i1:154-1395(+)